MTSSASFGVATVADEGAPGRRVLDLPGERSVAFVQAGDGRDCLLIHGTLMVLEDMWLGVAPVLAERFRVTAVDRPGHGLSRRRRLIDASPWRQAEILHAFAEAAGLRRPLLVGHSYGGTVALAYALLYPADTSGVVALAPMCLPAPRPEAILFGPRATAGFGDLLTPVLGATIDPLLLQLLWRAIFLPQSMPNRFSDAFPFALAAGFGQTISEGEDANALLPGLIRLAAELPSCSAPVRVLGGTADVVVHNATQGRIAAAMMPDASYTSLPGLGHMIHHFAPSEVLAAALSLR